MAAESATPDLVIPDQDGLYWYHTLEAEPEPVLVSHARYPGRFKAFNGREQSWVRPGDFFTGPIAPPSAAKPALPTLAAAVLDSVAQEWDGCMCEAAFGEIDVGSALRESFPKHWETLAGQRAERVHAAAQRVRAYLDQHARAIRLDQELLCAMNLGSDAEVSISVSDLRALLVAADAA